MIRSEYQRFMQTLHGQDATDAMRKLANIVSAHFDELLPLTTHQGELALRLAQKQQGLQGAHQQIHASANELQRIATE